MARTELTDRYDEMVASAEHNLEQAWAYYENDLAEVPNDHPVAEKARSEVERLQTLLDALYNERELAR